MEPDKLTPREMDALRVLWEQKRITVRELHDILRRQDAEEGKTGELAYTSVLSLLQSMESKDLIGHEKDGKTYIYFPKVSRDGTCRRIVSVILQRLLGGAVDEYVARAIESKPPSVEELERIEEMIAETKAKTRKQKRDKRK